MHRLYFGRNIVTVGLKLLPQFVSFVLENCLERR